MDPIKLTAGVYWIGDLCYVLGNRWDEFCALTIEGHNVKEGAFTMADGTQFITFGTAYGDGLYYDQEGNEYPVDAGLIGCVLADKVDHDARLELGKVHTFVNDVWADSDGKVLNFGHIQIDTDPIFEEEFEDEWEDEDEDN
jgi:hypothetical protein